jgi:host factor-I protein
MRTSLELQSELSRELAKACVPVAIYLVNGIRLQGQIDSFDQYGVLLSGNNQQFVFKHTISTFVPSREVSAALRIAYV